MIKIPELLMPAGGPEQLKAAVANGADAVYMSGSMFNARVNARNFTEEEIREAIDFAHLHGTKIHITQNTLIKNEEIKNAIDHAIRMYELGADALILQDRGIASIIKKVIPEMTLHLSTQGTVYDTSGVLSAAEAGFSRVILSRELSLEEIREIRKNSPIEIEIFVHGAICICYSGQCHMSDFIGGRSGNRGACAQPCRLPYDLRLSRDKGYGDSIELSDINGSIASKKNANRYLTEKMERFPLSPADMNLVTHLKELAEAGVDSIKIEGRMKSPEYVAAVASTYRKYLDMLKESFQQPVSASDIKILKQMFNRGDFTDAYIMGKSDQTLMSEDIPKHKGVYVGKTLYADKKRGHVVIRLNEELSNGDGIEIRTPGGTCGNIITYIKEVSDKSQKISTIGKIKNKTERQGKKENVSNVLLKTAASGMVVEVGDIPALASVRGDISAGDVYKITDKKLMKQMADSFEKIPQMIDVEFIFNAKAGDYGTLTATVHEGENSFYSTVSSSQIFQPAINKPTDIETVKQRLAKTGGTPYRMSQCFVELTGEPVIPASELNNMRRTVLEDISNQRMSYAKPTAEQVSAARARAEELIAENLRSVFLPVESSVKQHINLFFYEEYNCRERIRSYIEFFGIGRQGHLRIPDNTELVFIISARIAEEEVLTAIKSAGMKAAVYIPAITKDWSAQRLEKMATKLENFSKSQHIIGVYAANTGHAHLLRRYDIPLFYDEGMNLYNLYSFAEGIRNDMKLGVISHELSPDELKQFLPAASYCEITVAGRIPLMYMEHCLAGSGKWQGIEEGIPCTAEKKRHYCRMGKYTLKDRKGEEFPVICDDEPCRSMIISHRKIQTESYKKTIKTDFTNFRIYVYDEEPETIDFNIFA